MDKGRVAAVEILKATMRTRDYIEKGEGEGKTLLDAMRDGDTEGMQHFDGVIEKLIRTGDRGFRNRASVFDQRRETCAWSWRITLRIRNSGAKQPRVKQERMTEIEVEP